MTSDIVDVIYFFPESYEKVIKLLEIHNFNIFCENVFFELHICGQVNLVVMKIKKPRTYLELLSLNLLWNYFDLKWIFVVMQMCC